MKTTLIRPLNHQNQAEILIVAERMRKTLQEVLGETAGTNLYTMDWLEQRVRFHLDPANVRAQIFLAEGLDQAVIGHTIVRVERDEKQEEFGLYSTIYVQPNYRNQGVAEDLLVTGEKWMVDQAMERAQTYTSDTNQKLIKLFEKHGHTIIAHLTDKKMVVLEKELKGRL